MTYTTSNHGGILDSRLNSSDYNHPRETNLLNLHKAMQYRDGTDPPEPEIRVNVGNGFVISGNVNIPGTVTVNSSPDNPVHTHITEVGTSGNLLADNISYLPIGGNVLAFQGDIPWLVNANITNNITVSSITSNVNVNPITGNVSVTQGTTPWLVNANIVNSPTISSITSNVNVNPITGNVSVTQGTTPWLVNANIVNSPTISSITSNVNVNPITGSVNTTVLLGGNLVSNANPFPIIGNVGITGNVTMVTGNVPPQVSFADTVQMDNNDRLRVSVIGQQWWYVPSVDKDGDLRIQEAFQGNTGGGGNVAASTFIQNLASVRLTSGQYYNANARLTGSAIRASRRRHKTRPGVTSEWMGIVNWDGLQNNVIKRIGMFTNFNGVFFEANATGVNAVVRRRLTDGTLLEDRIPYTDWNQDSMNGLGKSGYNWNSAPITANVTGVVSQANVAISGDGTVYQVTYQLPAGEETRIPVGHKVTLTGLSPDSFNDTGMVTSIDTVNHRANVAYIVYPGTYISATNAKFTNTPFHAVHTYWFDFNGSRTTRVRFGMLTDNGKILCHNYVAGEVGSQMFSAPALMDRKEIVNTGQPVAFLPSMTIGGSAVTIEAQSEINPGFGVAQTTTPVTFDKNTDVGKEWAILGVGIRIGEPYQRSDLQVNKLQMVDLGNLNPQNAGIFQWRLVLNPSFGGTTVPSATNVGKATRAYYYSAGTTISGGITLVGGYTQGTWTGDVQTALNFLNMGSNIDYTDSDLVVFCVKFLVKGTDNSSIVATIDYTEDL